MALSAYVARLRARVGRERLLRPRSKGDRRARNGLDRGVAPPGPARACGAAARRARATCGRCPPAVCSTHLVEGPDVWACLRELRRSAARGSGPGGIRPPAGVTRRRAGTVTLPPL